MGMVGGMVGMVGMMEALTSANSSVLNWSIPITRVSKPCSVASSPSALAIARLLPVCEP